MGIMDVCISTIMIMVIIDTKCVRIAILPEMEKPCVVQRDTNTIIIQRK